VVTWLKLSWQMLQCARHAEGSAGRLPDVVEGEIPAYITITAKVVVAVCKMRTDGS
jgi:hypothetical protein